MESKIYEKPIKKKKNNKDDKKDDKKDDTIEIKQKKIK